MNYNLERRSAQPNINTWEMYKQDNRYRVKMCVYFLVKEIY
jgi:hypothetical protein